MAIRLTYGPSPATIALTGYSAGHSNARDREQQRLVEVYRQRQQQQFQTRMMEAEQQFQAGERALDRDFQREQQDVEQANRLDLLDRTQAYDSAQRAADRQARYVEPVDQRFEQAPPGMFDDARIAQEIAAGRRVLSPVAQDQVLTARNNIDRLWGNPDYSAEEKANLEAQARQTINETYRRAQPPSPEQVAASPDARHYQLLAQMPPHLQGKPWQYDAKTDQLVLPRGFKEAEVQAELQARELFGAGFTAATLGAKARGVPTLQSPEDYAAFEGGQFLDPHGNLGYKQTQAERDEQMQRRQFTPEAYAFIRENNVPLEFDAKAGKWAVNEPLWKAQQEQKKTDQAATGPVTWQDRMTIAKTRRDMMADAIAAERDRIINVETKPGKDKDGEPISIPPEPAQVQRILESRLPEIERAVDAEIQRALEGGGQTAGQPAGQEVLSPSGKYRLDGKQWVAL